MDKNRRRNVSEIIMKKIKIICAMSGGIDSSVAAAILKKIGLISGQVRYGVNFDVIGVFMRFWPPNFGQTEFTTGKSKNNLANKCCSQEAENGARKVAKILKIPFYVFNFEKEFKKRIVDFLLKEYKAGRTPNPCVVCNKIIKFGLLLEKALQLEADYVATGHYARLKQEIPDAKCQIPKYKLLRAKDKNKDQSYFLWQLNQEQLRRILFPIGDYSKKEVRQLAKKFKLPVLKIPESMEICFVSTTINDFLKRHLKTNPGKIVTVKGKEIGQHQGLWFYTLGQRKGIGVSGGPYWVLDKDLNKNTLIVTKNEKDLSKKRLTARDVNWISGVQPKLPLEIKAKIRYQHQPATAVITKKKNSKNYLITFARAQRAITPGQSVVFYKNEVLLGGGIIG